MRACSISYSLLYGMVLNTQLATDTRSTTTTHHHRLGWTMSNTIQSNLNTSCNVRNMFTQITIVQKVNIADRPWRIYVLSCTSLKWLLRATNQLDQWVATKVLFIWWSNASLARVEFSSMVTNGRLSLRGSWRPGSNPHLTGLDWIKHSPYGSSLKQWMNTHITTSSCDPF